MRFLAERVRPPLAAVPRLVPLAAALLAFLLPGAAGAHPIHTSLAEADYNRATRKLEVALKVFADDFEAALSAHAGHRISLEKTPRPEFVRLAADYVRTRFVMTDAAGTPAPHEWIGHDLKDAANELWLFFEIAVPAGLDDATLHHTVLAERFSDQLNTVQLRDAERRTTLVFLPGHGPKRIRFRPQ